MHTKKNHTSILTNKTYTHAYLKAAGLYLHNTAVHKHALYCYLCVYEYIFRMFVWVYWVVEDVNMFLKCMYACYECVCVWGGGLYSFILNGYSVGMKKEIEYIRHLIMSYIT